MTDIEKLLMLNYKQCFDYLIKKYGAVPGDYFLNETCRSKNNKITRGNEGLYIHHFDEDKAIMLSTKDWAVKNPYRYQKSDRLVYCNLLEHLVLHIKIVEFPNSKANSNERPGVGGIINFIVPELNDIYSGITYKQKWKQAVVDIVLPLKKDYLKCITKLIKLNFEKELLMTSFNSSYGLWNNLKNSKIYKEISKINVKDYEKTVFKTSKQKKIYLLLKILIGNLKKTN